MLVYFQELVADFLFVLCKENVNRLIKYTGYGNAAGLLASRGLMGVSQSQRNGTDYSSDDDDSETEEYAMDKLHIDPMIGDTYISSKLSCNCFYIFFYCFCFSSFFFSFSQVRNVLETLDFVLKKG